MKSFRQYLRENDHQWLYRYWNNHSWANEDDARAHIRRRIERDNAQYGNLFGKATDPDVVHQLKFIKHPKGVQLSKKFTGSKPKQEPIKIHTELESDHRAPDVDWHAKDLADDGTDHGVMKSYGRGKGVVKNGYIETKHLPKPRGGGIGKDGTPNSGAYGWDELQHKGSSPPPAKLRINKNNRVSILDGNHRIAHWNTGDYTHIPAKIIDER